MAWRLVVTWLLLLAFQGLVAVYLDFRGPVHFHVDGADDGHRVAGTHFHGPDNVAHHHHDPADATVVSAANERTHVPLATSEAR